MPSSSRPRTARPAAAQGTSSLGSFLRRVGFKPKLYPTVPAKIGGKGLTMHQVVNASEGCFSFEDYPWCCDMRAIEAMLRLRPTTRFVLTVREPASWWSSVDNWVNHVHVQNTQKKKQYENLLNSHPLKRETAIKGMQEHNTRVRTFFRQQHAESQLLEVNLLREEPLELSARLCAFLGVSQADWPACRRAFPHSNSATYEANDHDRRNASQSARSGMHSQRSDERAQRRLLDFSATRAETDAWRAVWWRPHTMDAIRAW